MRRACVWKDLLLKDRRELLLGALNDSGTRKGQGLKQVTIRSLEPIRIGAFRSGFFPLCHDLYRAAGHQSDHLVGLLF